MPINSQILRVQKRDTLITSDTPITLRTPASNYLSALKDVSVESAANNTYLVYNSTTALWEPHTISGTADEVEISLSAQNLTIGLPNSVVISTLTVTNSVIANNVTFGNIDCGEF